VLAHPPYSPDLSPCDYWLLAHVKEYLWGKQFKSDDDVNIAVTATVHHLGKDIYKAALYLPHRWAKCVDSAGDYTE
jgi:transposase